MRQNRHHDLRVYAESLDGAVYHYRDDAGREADAVVVFKDGSWGLVEVKPGSHAVEEGARNLLDLAQRLDCDIMGKPAFLMVLTTEPYAFRRKDGVYWHRDANFRLFSRSGIEVH